MHAFNVLSAASVAAKLIQAKPELEQVIPAAYQRVGLSEGGGARESLAIRLVRLFEAAEPSWPEVLQFLRNHTGRPAQDAARTAEDASATLPNSEAQRLLTLVKSGAKPTVDLFDGAVEFGIGPRELDVVQKFDIGIQSSARSPTLVRCLLDYPLETPCLFAIELSSPSRGIVEICDAIVRQYALIYRTPERYGVWGHDMSDLIVEGLLYYPDENLIYAAMGS
jgi:hypothetical protein